MEIVPVKERRVNNEDVNSKQKKSFTSLAVLVPVIRSLKVNGERSFASTFDSYNTSSLLVGV